jgi:hypothetical protein
LRPFGGLLVLIKFLDLVNFHRIFKYAYHPTTRERKLGHYAMMVGILMLFFVGSNRIWHFVYIRLDAMLRGFSNLSRLPAASTFWRYVENLGINQAKLLLKVMSILRERAWQLCDLQYAQVRINIDTTVKTVYGDQQGARKGHNTKHRGKEGLRPILCFIEETCEYLLGNPQDQWFCGALQWYRAKFFRETFRKKFYGSLDELQEDLDAWLEYYNNERPHRGYGNMGRRSIETIQAAK